MTLQELTYRINLSNNGYIFCPTNAEIACAKANPLEVEFKGGLIFNKGFKPPTYSDPKKGAPKFNFDLEADYEGAILDQQAHYLFD
jgi:hypothetical protein